MTEQHPSFHLSTPASTPSTHPVRRTHTFVLRLVVDAHDDLRGQISEPGSGDEWHTTFVGMNEAWALLQQRLLADRLGKFCPQSTLLFDGDPPMTLSQAQIEKLQEVLERLDETAQLLIATPGTEERPIGTRWSYSCPYCRAHGEHLPLDHESACPYCQG